MRPKLLELGLHSITKHPTIHELEILVLNDGIEDGTKEVCEKFSSLNIRYIFTGQRNKNGITIKRPPSFALNIGLKQCTGDIIVLSGPEMFHLNKALDFVVCDLILHPASMVIPSFIYFDQSQKTTNELLINREACINTESLVSGEYGSGHVEMPFLLALYKKYLLEINGWDENMIGYCGEDNDLILRLKRVGLTYIRTQAQAIHLWHGESTDGACHFENPMWVHNWNILQEHVNDPSIIKVNVDRDWGKLDE